MNEKEFYTAEEFKAITKLVDNTGNLIVVDCPNGDSWKGRIFKVEIEKGIIKVQPLDSYNLVEMDIDNFTKYGCTFRPYQHKAVINDSMVTFKEDI